MFDLVKLGIDPKKFEAPNPEPSQPPKIQPKIQDGKKTITIFSKVLGREVKISWQGDNPKVVHLDSMAFTTKEIETLKGKNPSPEDLQAVCRVKAAFDGEIQEQ